MCGVEYDSTLFVTSSSSGYTDSFLRSELERITQLYSKNKSSGLNKLFLMMDTKTVNSFREKVP